jgi:glycosyltransferase involved in cell wall biosynthesis
VNYNDLSIVIPAKNESDSLDNLLPALTNKFLSAEILVINDGSTDETLAVCRRHNVKVLTHPYSMGNGAAIKTGARNAKNGIIVFMDADGQHDFNDITRLLEKLDNGYEMAVGARQGSTHASISKKYANYFFNKLASYMTGFDIKDLTSGFRAVRARHFRKFLYLLPNGFSYPTTSTMAFFRSGLPVGYVPIRAGKREGKSHIRIIKDGIKFLVIIVKIGALFSPMRLFLPISGALFLLGISYYIYTFVTMSRFTNMSALLFTSAILVFLIGILSEQISSLHYKNADEDQRRTKRD